MQFEFGDRALESEQQSSIGAARIIDAVAIGNQAAAHAADVQEWIPVGAVACQARDVDREDQPHLAETDTANKLLEAAALRRRCSAQSEIGVDHVDIGVMPAEFASALAKSLLEPKAFLIAHHLVGRRLPDVDDRLARQMVRRDQLRLHGESPPGSRRPRRRSGAGMRAVTPPKDTPDLCS